MQELQETSFDPWEDPLEEEMAPHSSILVWRIPWTEEPGRLQSMGTQSQTRLSDFHFRYMLGTCDAVDITSWCNGNYFQPIYNRGN